MKERPILFSGEMVRAILNGTKTQTRRMVKWRKSLPDGGGFDCVQNLRTGGWVPMIEGRLQWSPYGGAPYQDYPFVAECCPYGVPGDRLIVKEAAWMWCGKLIQGLTRKTRKPKVSWVETRNNAPIYCADHPAKPEHVPVNGVTQIGGLSYEWHKKNARFLPRWASRITLEVVSVRVERLGEINGVDAWREGCPYHPKAEPTPDDVKSWYRDLWEKINGAGSWAVNPWVWVVEFKRVEGGSFVR